MLSWGLYHCFGPTRKHLYLETIQVMCLLLITTGILQARGDELRSEDGIYLLLLGGWLSRHIWFRTLCVWDPSSEENPSLRGLLSRILTTHVTGGQSFDRPNNTTDMVPRTLVYFFHLITAPIVFALGFLPSSVKDRSSSTIETIHAQWRRAQSTQAGKAVVSMAMWTRSFWISHGPSVQFVLIVFVLWLLVPELWARFYNKHFMVELDPQVDSEDIERAGIYTPFPPNSWMSVVFWMATTSTGYSLLLFARLMPPLAYLVSGSTVIGDIRSAAQSAVVKDRKPSSSDPWVERVSSISRRNRIDLTRWTIVYRVLENVTLCAIMPRLGLICRITGHCPTSPNDLTRVMYPGSIVRAKRMDGSMDELADMFATHNIESFLSCVANVLLLTLVFTTAESLWLNRSYLSNLGYATGEWALVRDRRSTINPVPWDPRRKYKKDDVVLYERKVYRATANAPEGTPLAPRLTQLHGLIRGEVGHLSTSRLLRWLTVIESLAMGIYLSLWIIFQFAGGQAAQGRLVTALAHGLATVAVGRLGETRYHRLAQLNAELSKTA